MRVRFRSLFVASLLSLSPFVHAQTTTVGSIPAEFSVSGGSASYSIPIQVASERGGVCSRICL